MLEYVDYCQRLSRRLGYILNGDCEEVESIAYEALGELATREEIDITRPLIAQAVRTKLYDELRRLKCQKRTVKPRTLDKQFDLIRTTEEFDDLVECCTELQRQILRLHFMEGYTLEEIAGIVNLTERQVQHQKLKAHALIRRRIDASDDRPRWQSESRWGTRESPADAPAHAVG